MKTRGLLVIVVAMALSFAPRFVDTSSAQTGAYSAKLISPTLGQVVQPGQTVRVEWKSRLPRIDLGHVRRKSGCRWTAVGHSLRGLARG